MARLLTYLVYYIIYASQYESAPQSCGDYADFIYAGPRVHGKVEKRGTLPAQHWWNIEHYSKFRQMRKFIEAQELQITGNKLVQNGYLPRHPIRIPMSEKCQIFVSHAYKLIYVKLPKTAGSSLIRNFQRNCRTFNETGKRECINADFERPNTERIQDAKTAQQMWKDYFVFTGVRNPYARGASAYAYLLGRRAKEATAGKEQCVNWPTFAQFCKAPFVIGMHTDKYDCLQDKVHDYLHVEPQVPCIVDENGEFVVDFIISLENLEADYEAFKQELLARVDLNETQKAYFRKFAQLEYQHRNAVSGGNTYAQNMYKRCGESCVENLAAYYSDDFEILGYENCIYKSWYKM